MEALQITCVILLLASIVFYSMMTIRSYDLMRLSLRKSEENFEQSEKTLERCKELVSTINETHNTLVKQVADLSVKVTDTRMMLEMSKRK